MNLETIERKRKKLDDVKTWINDTQYCLDMLRNKVYRLEEELFDAEDLAMINIGGRYV